MSEQEIKTLNRTIFTRDGVLYLKTSDGTFAQIAIDDLLSLIDGAAPTDISTQLNEINTKIDSITQILDQLTP